MYTFTQASRFPYFLFILVKLDFITGSSDEAPECPANMSEILKAEQVVPEVIDNVPKHHINIAYSLHCFVNFGNVLRPEKVARPVYVMEWFCTQYQYFTLLLVGPDEPTRDSPTDREFLYWLVVNVPLNAVYCGDDMVEYLPPAPKKDTGVHRYVYIMLHQPNGNMTFDAHRIKNTTLAGREKWSSKAFMKKHGFEEAYAVNFFKSEWQDPQA
nr:PREDICTED: protein D2-like [Bemisia tabaci]